ncbi:MAG: type II toxin-antitoxin system HicB family antitoxin [Anaerovoracaceae bacterium]
MKENILEYKGYLTSIIYDNESKMLFGKVEGINDLVLFESDSLQEIEQSFHDAVDEYLEFCEECGDEPDKAYKGVFNVRISPELHRKIAMEAIKTDTSVNDVVKTAIERRFAPPNKIEATITHKFDINKPSSSLEDMGRNNGYHNNKRSINHAKGGMN